MTNQRNPQPEYEDLTRFADENFDSDEVDLFQFSGNSETSPLTKLKSVILSLEWEITDEYLQELAEELAALTPSLQDDKVAKLYLQGMGKIGKYLRLRGAHAHANAIKLLLRYFYDFESILNSPDMDNERINKVVQNDVRMFKVLQYQIKLAEETPEEGEGQPGMATGVVRDTGKAGNALRLFKAAILELDWEVSNESLERFSDALKALSEEEIQNKSALILIQGMQALGDYISEQRAHAHPEVFNLLHAFHDGLERILDTGPAALDQKQKKRILVDRINRLNHLKKLIAPQDAEVPEAVSMAQAVAEAQARGPAEPAPEETAAPAVAETPAPEAPAAPADEEPALFDDNVAPALADAEAPAAPAAAIPGVIGPDDDYDDDDVDPRFAGRVTPALSDVAPALSDVAPALSDAEAPATPADDAALFDDIPPALADEEPGPITALAETEMEIKEPPATGAGIAAEIDDLFGPAAKQPAGEQGDVAPALADADTEPALAFADEGAPTVAQLDSELDAFFGESTAPTPPPEAPAAPAVAHEEALSLDADIFADEPATPAAPIAGGGDDDDEDELGLFPPTTSTDDLPSALADADEPREDLELGAEDAELSAKLDSFFDFPSEPAPAASEPPPAPAAAPEEALSLDADLFAEEPASPAAPVAEAEESLSLDADLFAEEPAPALADAEAPAAPADGGTLSLDADLFAEEPAPALADAETPAAPADDTLFFEEEPATPALADEEGEDTLVFIDEPAHSQPDLLGETAPAPADDILFGEEPAAPAAPVVETPADEPVAALADADEPGEESLNLETDEELTAQLDDFFDQMPGGPAPAEPAPALADAAPVDDMLLFEEEPAAHGAEPVETLTLDGDMFGEAPAAAHDDMPSALADAEMPSALADAEPGEETLTFEADEELTAHLDGFFDIPGESAPAAPAEETAPALADATPAEDPGLFLDEAALSAETTEAPAMEGETLFADEPAPALADESPATEPGLFLDEADFSAETPEAPVAEGETLFADEPAPALADEPPAEEPGLFLDEADLVTETAEASAADGTLFADEPAPVLVAESPTEEPGLFLDESDLAVEEGTGEGALFADGPMDESPAMPIPEEELEAAQPKVFEDVVEALADVKPGRGKKAAREAEADAGFQNQLDSFFDQPQSAEIAPPPEEEHLFAQEETPETPVVTETEPVAAPEDAAGDETQLFAEAKEEPAAHAEAEATGDATLLFAEESAEEDASGMLTLDDNLFAAEETQEPPAPAEEDAAELRLERKAAPADFDDLVTADELRDIMNHDGDIEDISDDELALDEDAPAPQAIAEAPPLEAALNGDFDEPAPDAPAPLFGDEEKSTLAAMDDLFGAQDEGMAAVSPAPLEGETLSVEDVVADESVLFASEANEPAPAAEASAFFAEEPEAVAMPAVTEADATASPATGMTSLSASLPALIAGYTADQLDHCRQELENLRRDGELSPVQTAAAGMLDSVLTGMPETSEQLDAATASLLVGLHAALAAPEAQLPLETVTAYSAWVQSHVSSKHRPQPVPAPDSEARDLFRELTEFRSRMEQELAQLREEIKKR